MICTEADEETLPAEPLRLPLRSATTPLKPFAPFSGYGTTIPSVSADIPFFQRVVTSPVVATLRPASQSIIPYDLRHGP